MGALAISSMLSPSRAVAAACVFLACVALAGAVESAVKDSGVWGDFGTDISSSANSLAAESGAPVSAMPDGEEENHARRTHAHKEVQPLQDAMGDLSLDELEKQAFDNDKDDFPTQEKPSLNDAARIAKSFADAHRRAGVNGTNTTN